MTIWQNCFAFFYVFLPWTTITVTSVMLWSWNKERYVLKQLSRELVPQIERHSNSCQYPLINYLDHILVARRILHGKIVKANFTTIAPWQSVSQTIKYLKSFIILKNWLLAVLIHLVCLWSRGIPQKVFTTFDNIFHVYYIDEKITRNWDTTSNGFLSYLSARYLADT